MLSDFEYFVLDVKEFLGKIEMQIVRFLQRKYFDNLTENDIPKDSFYCYEGCRIVGKRCPYLDYSLIYKSHYCHYIQDFDILLDDECKMCGINEPGDEEE